MVNNSNKGWLQGLLRCSKKTAVVAQEIIQQPMINCTVEVTSESTGSPVITNWWDIAFNKKYFNIF